MSYITPYVSVTLGAKSSMISGNNFIGYSLKVLKESQFKFLSIFIMQKCIQNKRYEILDYTVPIQKPNHISILSIPRILDFVSKHRQ